MIQMRLAAVTTYAVSTDRETMRCTSQVSPPPERSPGQRPSQTPVLVNKSVPTRLSPALVSLVDPEFAAFDAIANLGPLYTDYHTALADGHTAQRCELPQVLFRSS
jgi:hypothetical protein